MAPLRLALPSLAILLALVGSPLRAAETPGLGNLDYSSSHAVWDSLLHVHGSTTLTPHGHGTVLMVNGYLLVVFSSDGGGGGGDGGFALLDVSDPRAATTVFTTDGNSAYANAKDIREAHGLAVRGDIVVMGTNKGSSADLQFWDFSTPTDDPEGSDPSAANGPQLVGELDLGLSGGDYTDTPWWLSWQGRWLYVSAANQGLFIVDAADPTAPVLADRGGGPNPIPTSELGGFRFNQVLTVGNLLVGANVDLKNGILIADISDPLQPVKRWTNLDESVGYSFTINEGKIIGAHDPTRYWDLAGWDDPADDTWDPGAAVIMDGAGGRGGYGTVQDGVFHVGKSNSVSKVEIATGNGLGNHTPTKPDGSSIGSPDWDFSVVLGNLVFGGNDHSSGSSLMVHQLSPDTTPPTVTMVVPSDGATDQALTSRIGLTFSDQVLPETISGSTILVRPQGGSAIAGSFASQTGIVNFTPDADLAPSTTYEIVVVDGGVEDYVGNAVDGTTTFTFTTVGDPPSGGPLTCDLVAAAPAEVGASVDFAATASGGSGELEYRWDFGDGTVLAYDAGASVDHSYAEPGHYQVSVTVRDAEGTIETCTVSQLIHQPLTARPATNSSTIVHDPDRDRIYVVNPDNDSVTAIRATGTPRKDWEVAVGDHPRTLALDADGDLWVVCQDDASLWIIDPDDRSTTSLALEPGSDPFGIAIDTAADHAYVSLQITADDPHRASGALLKVDCGSTGSLATLGRAVLPAHVRGVAVSGDGARVLVTRFHSPAGRGEVIEVDAVGMDVTRTFALAIDPGLGGGEPDDEANGRGVPNYIQHVAISPDGLRAWVPSKKDNIERGQARDGRDLTFETTVRTIVTPLDLVTNAEVLAERVDFNDADLANAVAFSPYGDYGFVSLQGTNEVVVLDAYSGAPVLTIEDSGAAPQGLVVTDDGRLFVHHFMDRSVRAYDLADLLAGTATSVDPIGGAVGLVASEALAAEVLAGKRIFYDAADDRMSRDDYLSCASCHLDGGSDQRVWDFTQRGEGVRNTVDLRGRAGASRGPVHWTGNFDEIHDFENDIRQEFGGEGFLPDADWNDLDVRDPLGDAKAGRSTELDQLAAYVSSLDSVGRSPFREAGGDLTPAAWRGRELFVKASCHTCHSGSDYSDSQTGQRHDVGTTTADSGSRIGGALDGFDTPSLLGLWRTAPYLHDGSAADLHAVLANADHGDPELLTSAERDDLVAFLLQLDDDAPSQIALRTIEIRIDPTQLGDTAAFTITPDPEEAGSPTTEPVTGGARFENLDNGADHRIGMMAAPDGGG